MLNNLASSALKGTGRIIAKTAKQAVDNQLDRMRRSRIPVSINTVCEYGWKRLVPLSDPDLFYVVSKGSESESKFQSFLNKRRQYVDEDGQEYLGCFDIQSKQIEWIHPEDSRLITTEERPVLILAHQDAPKESRTISVHLAQWIQHYSKRSNVYTIHLLHGQSIDVGLDDYLPWQSIDDESDALIKKLARNHP